MKVKLNCITQPRISSDPVDLTDSNLLSPEEYIIYAARVSSPDNRLNHDTAPKLLKYLIDHHHWSPFEMVSIGIEIVTSRAIAQQILRHRSFSFQEFSQRYAEVTDMEPIELRIAANSNRQSSSQVIPEDSVPGIIAKEAVETAQKAYQALLDCGVATESARMVLPLTTQTTIVMHGTLRSWIHFFDQRCSDHAQKEIRDIAFASRSLIGEQFPWTKAALDW